jgi:tight adherence protein C
MTAVTAAGMLSVLIVVLAVDRVRVNRRTAGRFVRFGIVTAAEQAPSLPARRGDVLRLLGSYLARLSTRDRMQQLRLQLVRAGVSDRLSPEEFLGLRVLAVLTGIAVAIILALLLGPVAVLLAAVGGPVGYVLPPMILRRLAQQRRQTIDSLLPGVIDVLTVSLEAGLGFDSGIAFLCERMDNELIVEFRRYLADMRLGRSRRQALEAMVDRTQSADLRELVAAIIQAEELGTGMVRTLRGQADALRSARRWRAEELAREAPVKLLIPIVLFIMPVLFIVIMGPVAIHVIGLLGKK